MKCSPIVCADINSHLQKLHEYDFAGLNTYNTFSLYPHTIDCVPLRQKITKTIVVQYFNKFYI